MCKNLSLTLLLIFSILYSSGQNASQIKKKEKEFPYYLIIDMNHLQHDNKFNYKCLVNNGYDKSLRGEYKILDDKSLYFINYKYISAPEKGFDYYDRMALDTIKVKLSEKQLEKIFVISTELFNLKNPKEKLNKKRVDSYYDGEYVNVILGLDNYSTRFQITMAFDDETMYQQKFNELIAYIEEIKNGL